MYCNFTQSTGHGGEIEDFKRPTGIGMGDNVGQKEDDKPIYYRANKR